MSTALLLINGTPSSAFDGLRSTPIKGKQNEQQTKMDNKTKPKKKT
jgi:hypothetical protein